MSTAEIAAPPDVGVAEALQQLAAEGRPGVCDTGRYCCRYALWGAGPPVVFIHGLSDIARSFAMVAAELSRDFTCVLYELPIGGADGARLGGYRHRHFALDLFALMDHLGMPRTYVVGSSLGATVALRATAERPERFARAVLQGAFARRPVGVVEVALCRFARFWPGPMRKFPVKTSLKRPSEAAVFAAVPPDRAEFLAANCGSTPIAAVASYGLLIAKLDLRPLLPAVRIPVRLVGGDRDEIVRPAAEMEVLSELPFAERVEIPGCGHVPQYTHPGLLAELIRQFFTPECGRDQVACSAQASC